MRIAFISDIHEDRESLEKVLIEAAGLQVDEMVCMGDICGYNQLKQDYAQTRSASACLKLIREHCSHIIPGNHDLYACKCIPSQNKLFDFPPDWYELSEEEQRKLGEGKVWLFDSNILEPDFTEEDQAFIKSLSEIKRVEFDGLYFLLLHYIYPNTSGSSSGFYKVPEEFEKHKTFMREQNCFFSVSGHYHYPGLFVSQEKKIYESRSEMRYSFDRWDSLLAPPLLRQKGKSRYMILDTREMHVEIHTC